MPRPKKPAEDKPVTAEKLADLVPKDKGDPGIYFRHLERNHELEFVRGEQLFHLYWREEAKAAIQNCQETCGVRQRSQQAALLAQQLATSDPPPRSNEPKPPRKRTPRSSRPDPPTPVTRAQRLVTTEELCHRFNQPSEGGIKNAFGKRMRWAGLDPHLVPGDDFEYDAQQADEVAFKIGLDEPVNDWPPGITVRPWGT